MTWHLKDRELEKKLIAIDPGFGEKLNQNCEIWDSNHDGDLCEFMHFKQILRYENKLLGTLLFTGDQIEEVPEYNPHAWNDFPLVTPPEGVPMRVESVCGQCVFRDCAIFDKGAWKDERDGEPINSILGEVKRFRPWEN